MRWVTVATFVLAVSTTFAQTPASTLRGSWAATVGPQTLQGTWTAQPVANDPNAAQGSWTLVSGNRIAASGTWSAAKAANGWTGSWQARVAGSGRLMSGTWRGDIKASDVRSLAAMLQKSIEEQVSGTWSQGRLGGSWSIRGTK